MGRGRGGTGFKSSGLPGGGKVAASRRQIAARHAEEQGVSSAGILAFLDAVAKTRHEFHSFMLVRHGHVVAEGWWPPYRANRKHTLYSLSKSFTSTAVGFAVSGGRLKVEDAVMSFFPRCSPGQR